MGRNKKRLRNSLGQFTTEDKGYCHDCAWFAGGTCGWIAEISDGQDFGTVNPYEECENGGYVPADYYYEG